MEEDVKNLAHSKAFLVGLAAVVILALYVAQKNKAAAAAAAAAGTSTNSTTTSSGTTLDQVSQLLQQEFSQAATADQQTAGAQNAALQNIATGISSGIGALAQGTSTGLTTLGQGIQTAITPVTTGVQNDADYALFNLALTSPLSCYVPNMTFPPTTRQQACIDSAHGDDEWLLQGTVYQSGNYQQILTAELNHYSQCKNADGSVNYLCVGAQMLTDRGIGATGSSNPGG